MSNINNIKVSCRSFKQMTSHTVLSAVSRTGYEEGPEIHWEIVYQIVECNGCQTVTFRKRTANSDDVVQVGKTEFEQVYGEILYPSFNDNTIEQKSYRNLPIRLQNIYKEIIETYNCRLWLMCAAGLRAAVEGICMEKGVSKGPVEIIKQDGSTEVKNRKSLEGKISGLYKKELLTKHHASTLHQHRFLGNNAVHELDIPDEKELLLAIQILEHTLENIFELPVKSQRLRESKNKRRGS